VSRWPFPFGGVRMSPSAQSFPPAWPQIDS
jgi:hypothetical protein